MGRLIAIDPGNNTGAAWFRDGVLYEAWVRDGNEWLLTPYEIEELAIEIPRIYPGGKGKGDPNDIIRVAVQAGEQIGAFLSRPCPEDCKVTKYAPAAWKGQVDGDIMCDRILGFLSEDERKILEKLPASTQHNAIDAVGIGLFHLRRMGRGGR